jgi:hypothetical protein
MPVVDLSTWMERWAVSGTVWLAKRLSANDTLANGSHQSGTYMPKEVGLPYFSAVNTTAVKNPDAWFDLYIDSHTDHRKVRLIYYNNHYFRTPEQVAAKKRGRDETRITQLGGADSPLLNPESTGALAIFVFVLDGVGNATECHVWVCDNQLEEDLIESDIGPVEPKQYLVWLPGAGVTLFSPAGPKSCKLSAADIPSDWLVKFPSGEELVEKTRELRPDTTLSVDERLIRRRACEFEVFKSIEEAFYAPKLAPGFPQVSEFLSLALTILQSRKSRSGRSLEFHTRDILKEELLEPGKHFSHQATTEGKKRPDFLFPSAAAYKDPAFPKERLRMLAAKTTCKDRWRQILNEADRIKTKHLLTLQEGVSHNQFQEMCEENVKLVVPAKLHETYPKPVQPHLMTLESFIAEVRLLNS